MNTSFGATNDIRKIYDMTKEDDTFLKTLNITAYPDSDEYWRRPARARKWSDHCPECKRTTPLHDKDCPLVEDAMEPKDEFGEEFNHFDAHKEDDPFEDADASSVKDTVKPEDRIIKSPFSRTDFSAEAARAEIEENLVKAVKAYLKIGDLHGLMHIITMLL
jgi:hypothetical protein